MKHIVDNQKLLYSNNFVILVTIAILFIVEEIFTLLLRVTRYLPNYYNMIFGTILFFVVFFVLPTFTLFTINAFQYRILSKSEKTKINLKSFITYCLLYIPYIMIFYLICSFIHFLLCKLFSIELSLHTSILLFVIFLSIFNKFNFKIKNYRDNTYSLYTSLELLLIFFIIIIRFIYCILQIFDVFILAHNTSTLIVFNSEVYNNIIYKPRTINGITIKYNSLLTYHAINGFFYSIFGFDKIGDYYFNPLPGILFTLISFLIIKKLINNQKAQYITLILINLNFSNILLGNSDGFIAWGYLLHFLTLYFLITVYYKGSKSSNDDISPRFGSNNSYILYFSIIITVIFTQMCYYTTSFLNIVFIIFFLFFYGFKYYNKQKQKGAYKKIILIIILIISIITLWIVLALYFNPITAFVINFLNVNNIYNAVLNYIQGIYLALINTDNIKKPFYWFMILFIIFFVYSLFYYMYIFKISKTNETNSIKKLKAEFIKMFVPLSIIFVAIASHDLIYTLVKGDNLKIVKGGMKALSLYSGILIGYLIDFLININNFKTKINNINNSSNINSNNNNNKKTTNEAILRKYQFIKILKLKTNIINLFSLLFIVITIVNGVVSVPIYSYPNINTYEPDINNIIDYAKRKNATLVTISSVKLATIFQYYLFINDFSAQFINYLMWTSIHEKLMNSNISDFISTMLTWILFDTNLTNNKLILVLCFSYYEMERGYQGAEWNYFPSPVTIVNNLLNFQSNNTILIPEKVPFEGYCFRWNININE